MIKVLTEAQIAAGAAVLCDCPQPKRIGRNAAIAVFDAMCAAQPGAESSAPDLDKLEALARAATPGPWTYSPMGETTDPEIGAANGSRVALLVAADVTKANSAFIAAANPAAVLDLIALARRATAPHAGPPQQIALQGGESLRYEARTTGEPGWLLYDDEGKLVKALSLQDVGVIEATIAATLAAQPVEAAGDQIESWSNDIALRNLAFRTLWLAYVWNDHNFKAAHLEARETCKKLGIHSFDEANAWLEKMNNVATHPAEPVGADHARGFSMHFTREQWGVIVDGVMLEIERSEKRKAANSESNSDERANEGRAILSAINAKSRGGPAVGGALVAVKDEQNTAMLQAIHTLRKALAEAGIKQNMADRIALRALDATSEFADAARDVGLAAESAAAPAEQTQAARDVLAERRRQVETEGWTPAHDDEYNEGELSLAAACYALQNDSVGSEPPQLWPWPRKWWKAGTERRNLVKAGALILADIERLDRATQQPTPTGEK